HWPGCPSSGHRVRIAGLRRRGCGNSFRQRGSSPNNMANETFTVNISGIEDVCKNLDAIPRKLAIGKALTAAAVPIVQELDVRTPVSDQVALLVRAATGKTAARGTLKAHLMSVVT